MDNDGDIILVLTATLLVPGYAPFELPTTLFRYGLDGLTIMRGDLPEPFPLALVDGLVRWVDDIRREVQVQRQQQTQH